PCRATAAPGDAGRSGAAARGGWRTGAALRRAAPRAALPQTAPRASPSHLQRALAEPGGRVPRPARRARVAPRLGAADAPLRDQRLEHQLAARDDVSGRRAVAEPERL